MAAGQGTVSAQYAAAVPVQSAILYPIGTGGTARYLLSTPFSQAELSSLVPPKSTIKTGMNCSALGLYTAGLISADVVKVYSDALAYAIDRFHADTVSTMDVDDDNQFMTNLESGERFTQTFNAIAQGINVNIDGGSTGAGFVDFTELSSFRDAATELMALFGRIPIGHVVPLLFSRAMKMKGGSGAHVVAFWRESETSALVVDIQRGECTAGYQCISAYDEWKKGSDVLGKNTNVLSNALTVRFNVQGDMEKSITHMRETIVRYMVRQGNVWHYYDPAKTEEQLLSGFDSPMLWTMGFDGIVPARKGIFLMHYKIPHNNALLASDQHSDEFMRVWTESRNFMRIDDNSVPFKALQKSFYDTMNSIPILVVRRPFVTRDSRGEIIYDFSPRDVKSYTIKILGASLPPLQEVLVNGSVAYMYIAPRQSTSGGRRRRPLSSPTRKARRSSSSSKKRYTRRQRALRS